MVEEDADEEAIVVRLEEDGVVEVMRKDVYWPSAWMGHAPLVSDRCQIGVR